MGRTVDGWCCDSVKSRPHHLSILFMGRVSVALLHPYKEPHHILLLISRCGINYSVRIVIQSAITCIIMVFNSFSKIGRHNYILIISDLSQRVDAVKDENLKLKSENQVRYQPQYSVPRGGGGGAGWIRQASPIITGNKGPERRVRGGGIGVMRIKLADFSA